MNCTKCFWLENGQKITSNNTFTIVKVLVKKENCFVQQKKCLLVKNFITLNNVPRVMKILKKCINLQLVFCFSFFNFFLLSSLVLKWFFWFLCFLNVQELSQNCILNVLRVLLLLSTMPVWLWGLSVCRHNLFSFFSKTSANAFEVLFFLTEAALNCTRALSKHLPVLRWNPFAINFWNG